MLAGIRNEDSLQYVLTREADPRLGGIGECRGGIARRVEAQGCIIILSDQRGKGEGKRGERTEAQILSGLTIETKGDMIAAAKQIGDRYHCAVLLKGGHSVNDANDLLYADGELHWFYGKRIDNPNTHGTGCTLSSAIAANLAKGFSLTESVQRAKDYISGALAAMLDLGEGSGPMNHAFDLRGEFAKEIR